jgi:hypothetical protein
MLKHILLLLGIMLVGCGGDEPRPAKKYMPSKALKEKYNRYREYVKSHQDVHGFIDTKYCDATLWSGLVGVSGAEVDLTAAADPDVSGRWYRRPTSYVECWSNEESRSTISKDMILGIMYWATFNKRLDVLQDIWAYGEANDWIMGDGRYGGVDTIMNPLFISTLAEAIYFLGGENHYVWRSVPEWYSENEGYKAHLQVLIMLFRQNLGLTNAIDYDIIKVYVERQPQNPLFRYALGQYGIAEALLLENKWWPSDRLPTTADRCADWILQKDFEDGWKPCKINNPVEHHGGDFLFLANILLKGKSWMTKSSDS